MKSKTSIVGPLGFSVFTVTAFIAVIMCMVIDPNEKAMVVHPGLIYTVVATSDNGQSVEVVSDQFRMWPMGNRLFRAKANIHILEGMLSVGERFQLPEVSENPLGPEIASTEQLQLLR